MSNWKKRQGKERKSRNFEEWDAEEPDSVAPDFEETDSVEPDFAEPDSVAPDFEDEDMAFEDAEDGEEEWEDEPKPLALWVMALLFLGMVLLAALICLVLWRFTHSGGDGDRGQDSYAQVTATPEMTPDPNAESVPETTPDPTATPVPEATPEPAVTPAPEATADPEETKTPQTDAGADGQAKEPISGNADMAFSEANESVTPKDVINLRSVPTTTDETNIVVQVQNGEVLLRTGINQDTGWSRIDYNGQTLYAVNQYLTTDLEYKTPVKPSDPNRVNTISGRIIIFTNCDDWISPKEYVNLRTEPSTTEGNSTVSCQLNYGEKAHRTGYSADSGWSRVEYNGQVLYVVTSLMYEVTE